MGRGERRSSGVGLEKTGPEAAGGWIASVGPVGGIELFSAWFAGRAFQRHRHDTYAVGLTDTGVQVFDYRGARQSSTPGQVVVLYPDEPHDGRAGTGDGFGYRIVYVEPGALAAALRVLRGRPHPLPFMRDVVSSNRALARAVARAFSAPLEALMADGLVMELAEALVAGERGSAAPAASRRVDFGAIERAREFLDAERTRVVHSTELESITGLNRYDLSRQFRFAFGTSPYRYLLMRRLEWARDQVQRDRPLADVAGDAGFADQAHFTRVFKSAFGLTPARYRRLRLPRAASAATLRPVG